MPLATVISAPPLTTRLSYRNEHTVARRVEDRSKIQILQSLQDNRCYLCDHRFRPGYDVNFRPTLDHVLPKAHGGGRFKNLLLAHRACNGLKADRMPTAREMAYLRVINALIYGEIS